MRDFSGNIEFLFIIAQVVRALHLLINLKFATKFLILSLGDVCMLPKISLSLSNNKPDISSQLREKVCPIHNTIIEEIM